MFNRLLNWVQQTSPETRRIVRFLITYKAVYGGLILLLIWLFPWLDRGCYNICLHYPREGEPTLATQLSTWDGAHYLYIAEAGYVSGSPSCAFYPLWPLIIKVFSLLTLGNTFVAGLILANALSIAGIALFHYLARQNHGLEVANLAVIFLLAFPGAIFFSFIYTESLFFLLVVLFFIFLLRDRYLEVAIIGFLLPLTKAVGVFLLAPLAWRWLSRKKEWRLWACVAAVLLGYASYFVIMYGFTGNPFEGFVAQRAYPNKPSIANLFNWRGITDTFLNIGTLHGSEDSALDRFLFLLFVFGLFGIWRLNKLYFAYAFFVGMVPALSTWFFSYSRNMMMCFPLFILLAQLLQGKDYRVVVWYLVLLLGAIQVLLLGRYVNFFWAG